ncbi:MAG TPA: hypothetical protein VKX17_00255 [Planctomycetota bacterium]|nr:hypothetical protein [Planctomycetota bacterium]
MQNQPDDNSDRVSEELPRYGEPVKIRQAQHAPLAPDGLPWPEGYFDFPIRVTLEEAIKRNGIRPSKYSHGRPLYTAEDRQNPKYIFEYPPETEWVKDLMKMHGIKDEDISS